MTIGKKAFGSQDKAVLYQSLCYSEMCYSEVVLYVEPYKSLACLCDRADCFVSNHGNISLQKLPQICTSHIVKTREIRGLYQNGKKW